MTVRHSDIRLSILGLAVLGGLAACGGDNQSPTVQQQEEDAQVQAPLYVASSRIWNNRTISVCWENTGTAYSTEKSWVMAAVRRTWQAESQIVFTFSDCGNANIRINWNDEGPHTHGLGTGLDGMANGMTLNPTFNNWSTSCKSQRQYCIEAIAVHEFGHALGFSHEQNRPDTPSTCTEAPQGSNGDTTVGVWDLSSTMNYCNPNWNNGGALSATDISGVRRFYGNRKRADWVARVMVDPGYWGTWTPVFYCSTGTWASGYSMRTEGSQGGGDDTALNAVSMACRTKTGAGTTSITPHGGYWGSWGSTAYCSTGAALRQATMQVESPQGSGDDTAANNIRFACTNGSVIQAPAATGWGSWRSWASCPAGTAVCGALVRTESPLDGDDTAMNGLQLDCCTY